MQLPTAVVLWGLPIPPGLECLSQPTGLYVFLFAGALRRPLKPRLENYTAVGVFAAAVRDVVS